MAADAPRTDPDAEVQIWLLGGVLVFVTICLLALVVWSMISGSQAGAGTPERYHHPHSKARWPAGVVVECCTLGDEEVYRMPWGAGALRFVEEHPLLAGHFPRGFSQRRPDGRTLKQTYNKNWVSAPVYSKAGVAAGGGSSSKAMRRPDNTYVLTEEGKAHHARRPNSVAIVWRLACCSTESCEPNETFIVEMWYTLDDIRNGYVHIGIFGSHTPSEPRKEWAGERPSRRPPRLSAVDEINMRASSTDCEMILYVVHTSLRCCRGTTHCPVLTHPPARTDRTPHHTTSTPPTQRSSPTQFTCAYRGDMDRKHRGGGGAGGHVALHAAAAAADSAEHEYTEDAGAVLPPDVAHNVYKKARRRNYIGDGGGCSISEFEGVHNMAMSNRFQKDLRVVAYMREPHWIIVWSFGRGVFATARANIDAGHGGLGLDDKIATNTAGAPIKGLISLGAVSATILVLAMHNCDSEEVTTFVVRTTKNLIPCCSTCSHNIEKVQLQCGGFVLQLECHGQVELPFVMIDKHRGGLNGLIVLLRERVILCTFHSSSCVVTFLTGTLQLRSAGVLYALLLGWKLVGAGRTVADLNARYLLFVPIFTTLLGNQAHAAKLDHYFRTFWFCAAWLRTWFV